MRSHLPGLGWFWRLGLALGMLVLGSGWGTSVQAAASASATEADEAGSLRAMLERAPVTVGGPAAPTREIAMFADVAARLAAAGIEAPESPDDEGMAEWIRATADLMIPGQVARSGLGPNWRETFGFDLLQIDQALKIGEPLSLTLFLRGRFDETEVWTALTGSGYEAIDVVGVTVLSIGPEGEVRLDTPIAPLAVTTMNNAVILNDGTLVFASTLATSALCSMWKQGARTLWRTDRRSVS